MATASTLGSLVSTHTYDPFGNAVTPLPTNTTTSSAFGWVGSHQKLTESSFTLAPIQMGARVYFPTLGRFGQVDSVEGGTLNNYVYAVDPVNQWDLSGRFLIAIPFAQMLFAAAVAALTVHAVMTNPAIKSGGTAAINNISKSLGSLLRQGYRSVPQSSPGPKGPKCKPREIVDPVGRKPSAPKTYQFKAIQAIRSDIKTGNVPGRQIMGGRTMDDIMWPGYKKYAADFIGPDGEPFQVHYLYNDETCNFGQVKIK